jgi:hypothetical protein
LPTLKTTQLRTWMELPQDSFAGLGAGL